MRPGRIRDGPATRQAILTVLGEDPGLTKSQLCRRIGLAWGTVSHHLRTLEAEAAVVRRHLLGRTRLFPAGLAEGAALQHVLASSPLLPALLASVHKDPGVGVQDLARALGVNRHGIRSGLGVLMESGLVARTHDYRPRFFVVEAGRAEGVIELAAAKAAGTPADGRGARARLAATGAA